jgi:hypothetical protein
MCATFGNAKSHNDLRRRKFAGYQYVNRQITSVGLQNMLTIQKDLAERLHAWEVGWFLLAISS